MEEKKIVNKKKAGVRAGLVIALVMGMMFVYTTLPVPQIKMDERGWHVVWEGNLAQAAEGNPGSGAGGILEIFFINHTASPATCYDTNSSSDMEAWCTAAHLGYTSADDFNTELAHSVAFDVVVRVRGNHTQCYRTDKFYHTDLKVEWTCAGLSIGADTAMTGVVSYNNSGGTYLYMNFYSNGGGSGFTLSKDQSIAITSIKFSAYY